MLSNPPPTCSLPSLFRDACCPVPENPSVSIPTSGPSLGSIFSSSLASFEALITGITDFPRDPWCFSRPITAVNHRFTRGHQSSEAFKIADGIGPLISFKMYKPSFVDKVSVPSRTDSRILSLTQSGPSSISDVSPFSSFDLAFFRLLTAELQALIIRMTLRANGRMALDTAPKRFVTDPVVSSVSRTVSVSREPLFTLVLQCI
mmetsp:Transcript_36272/g.87428  ORF Transcript_36272/g.87428 Transcript_36272/m.87428 type:complete len:204 (+) Transcript_36272:1010-1621(+)